MARKAARFNAINSDNIIEPELDHTKQNKSYSVALYARLSVELKMRPSESISNQMAIMKEFCKEKESFVQIYEYVDNGVSGTSFNRPAFQQMMADARNGKINCIIVKDLSRFGRTYIEAGNYIETILPFLGIRFISVNDHFDTEDGYNQNKSLEIALKNLVNDMYAKDISKRVACSRKMDMEKGKFVGSNAPYGYVVDRTDPLRKYVIDEDAAKVVQQIFGMALEGMTLRAISKALQDYSLSSPGEYLKSRQLCHETEETAKPWYIGTISTMLNNQAYIGNMVQGKRKTRLSDGKKQEPTNQEEWIIVENTHEAIIDRDTFYRVQDILTRKREDSSFNSDRGKNIPMKEDMFSGLVYCGTCGRKVPMMSRLVDKNGKTIRQYFYQCRYNYDIGKNDNCCGSWLEMDLIKVVYKSLSAQIALQGTDPKEFLMELNHIVDDAMKECEKKIEVLERKIQKIEYDASKSYESYVIGEITKEEFAITQKESESAINNLKGQIDDENCNQTKRRKQFDKEIKWWKAALKMKGKADLNRELLLAMVSKIELFPDKRLNIHFNFSNPYTENKSLREKELV